MKLRSLQMEGVTRFRKPVLIDFEALGPGLIAFVGSNGAGKTTLLECSGPAALWRELPTRPDPALQNWVGPRGGALELGFSSAGHNYVSTLKYPGRGTPSAVLSVDGIPVSSGKLKDYDAAVRERFGAPEAFYASAFAAQGGRGRFAALSVSDRKSIFRFYLGLHRVDAIHAAAKARLARVDVARAERLGKELEERRLRVPALKAEVSGKERAAAAEQAVRDSLRKASAELDARVALSAPVAAYRAALREVLSEQEEVTRLEALPPPEVPPEAPDPEEAYATLEKARKAAEEVRTLDADLEEARDLLIEARRIVEDARMRAAELGSVPCGGGGKFVTCKFLREAHAASVALPGYEAVQVEAATLVEIRESARESAEVPDLVGLERAWKEASRLTREHAAAAEKLRSRASSLEAARASLKRTRKRAIAMRRELPDPLPEVPPPAELEKARTDLEAGEARYDAAVRAVAAARAELTELLGRIDELEEEHAAEKAKAADGLALHLLTRGFGPGGIQALEIDAAGPAVSELADELVQSCYGDRFSLEIRTQRVLKSREGAAEDFSVEVHDAERGRSGPLASLSGGEQVVVDEALRTALSLFAIGSRASVEMETLWRDETPAALYGDNVARYLAMLHRARAIGGFHQVLFVGGPEAADAADAVVRVNDDGTVDVGR